MRTASRCCWSNRTWCRALRWRAASISSRTASSSCVEWPPISATTRTSNARISDCDLMEKLFDLVIKNARVVRPNTTSVDALDIAVKDGRVARLAPDVPAEQAAQVFDARNLLAFPGCVDAHMHIGIYAPLAEDAVSESKAAAAGGVTS